MTNPLLSTKFFCPQPRPNLVQRARLLEQLDAVLFQGDTFNRKLSLVSAPAGPGKTTLIADWLNQSIAGDLNQAVPLTQSHIQPKLPGSPWMRATMTRTDS